MKERINILMIEDNDDFGKLVELYFPSIRTTSSISCGKKAEKKDWQSSKRIRTIT